MTPSHTDICWVLGCRSCGANTECVTVGSQDGAPAGGEDSVRTRPTRATEPRLTPTSSTQHIPGLQPNSCRGEPPGPQQWGLRCPGALGHRGYHGKDAETRPTSFLSLYTLSKHLRLSLQGSAEKVLKTSTHLPASPSPAEPNTLFASNIL